MKYMIISDIHGNVECLNRVLDIYNEEKCNKLIILGDLSNYGIDYHRSDIVDILNKFKNNIIAIRGNCDADITDIEFDIPYVRNIVLNNHNCIMTHGHIYSKEDLAERNVDLIFIGHSHISNIEKINNRIIINPGSISIPRRGNRSFCILDDNTISIRDLDNNIINKYDLNN